MVGARWQTSKMTLNLLLEMTLTFKSLYLNMVAVIHSLVATNGRQTVSLEKGVFCH